MTHEPDVDDGDLEIEAWEQADAELAAQGLDLYDRIYLWRSLRSPEQVAEEELLETFAATNGVSLAEAHRIVHAMNGVTL